MTTPDAPDNAHGMDPHDSPGQRPAPDPVEPVEPVEPAAAKEPTVPAETAETAETAAAAEPVEPADPGNPADPAEAGTAPGDEDAPGLDGEPVHESAEEAALRDLMHGAVRDLQPSAHALEHLRRAVPARRQHRRQALAGAGAAVLLVGAAVPALIHAADTGGRATAAPANVASTHAAHPGEDGHVNTWGATGDSGQSSRGQSSGGSGHQPPSAGGADGPSNLATTPDGVPPVSAPECAGDQLGQGSSNANSLDADGRAYGWFRVTNVSTAACAVPPGPATVQVYAVGATDMSRISVVNHTADDPATGLPATASDTPLVLAPGADYEVAFAWVPGDAGPGGCPQPTSPPASPTPTDTPTDTPVPDPGSAGPEENPMALRLTQGVPTGDPEAVVIRHTPVAGAPVVVGPTLQGACAGTIYTTGPMPTTPSDTPAS
ncbi:hypothetical protein [Streptomyces sp. NBC_01198]|uniref:hypothetical protein n=1 Tax=Streptomyces sp. NBC_01198 TaxID=2903769 RepID=UPI002E138239|nr:hypothetical protein OG702_19115 [Streptomyces sp. NBC_01198]